MAAQSDVQLVVQVVDRATSEIKKIGDSFRGFEGAGASVISLNQALGLMERGLHLLAAAIKLPIEQFEQLASVSIGLVRKYDDQIRAQTQLRTAMRLQGDATGEQAEELIRLAAALQDVTRFDDDAIVAGQALAVTSGVQADQLEEFTRVAVDLAAALNVDVAQGFQKLVVGVQSGSIRGLKTNISDAADAAQRYADVIRFAGNATRGMAEETAKIGAGPIDQAVNKFEDFQQALGKIIAESATWKGFVQTAKEFFDALIKFAESHPDEIAKVFGGVFTTSFRLAATSISVFTDVLFTAGEAVASFVDLMDTLLPESFSPFKKLNDQINQTKIDMQAARAVFEGGLSPFIGTDPTAQASEQERSQALQTFDELEQKLAKLEDRKHRLSEGTFFGPLTDELKKIKDQVGVLADEAAQNPLLTGEGLVERAAENVADAAAGTGAFAKAARDLGDAAEGETASVKAFAEQVSKIVSESKQAPALLAELPKVLEQFGGSAEGVKFVTDQLERLRAQARITQQQFDDLSASIRNAFGAQAGTGSAGGAAPPSTGGTGGPATGAPRPATPTAAPTQGGALAQAAQALSASAQELRSAAAAHGTAAGELSASAQSLTAAAGGVDAAVLGLTEAGAGLLAVVDAQFDAASALMAAGSVIVKSIETAAQRLRQAAVRLYQAGDKLAGGTGVAPFSGQGGGVITGQAVPAVLHGPELVLPLNQRGIDFARQALGGNRGGIGGDGIVVNINVDRLQMSDRDLDRLTQDFSRKLSDRFLETARRAR